jgi:hypothetical protein
MRTKSVIIAIMVAAIAALAGTHILSPPASAADPGTGDWPMWGGTPDRNMVSNMKGLPISWDVKTKKNCEMDC